MKIEIRKAERKRSYLRLALCGVSGSGKTYSSLLVAAGMGQRILFIDSEQGSSNLYSDLIPQGFDVLEMSSHHPKDYIDAITAGCRHGADVIVIDSLSHAWMGKDGALELVDAAQGNKFAAWRTVTPLHNALVDAILTAPCHIIATMRSKSEWVLETNAKGKQEPRKVGLAPIQRDGIEYEFTCVGDISLDHVLTWSKTRIAELDGRPIRHPDQKLGAQLRAWVQGGKAQDPAPEPKIAPAPKQASAKPEPKPAPGPKAEAPKPEAPKTMSGADALARLASYAGTNVEAVYARLTAAGIRIPEDDEVWERPSLRLVEMAFKAQADGKPFDNWLTWAREKLIEGQAPPPDPKTAPKGFV